MKRKEFIKTSSVLMAGSLITPLTSCKEQPKHEIAQNKRTNWAGNYTYKAKNLYEPKSEREVQDLVQKLDKQKALGSRHCFNNIADSPLNQISTRYLNRVVSIDEEEETITIESGVRYGDFSPYIHQNGFAIHNLASLPHITVVGACTTATHGSGDGNGNMATAATALELVTANGDIHTIRKSDGDEFNGIIVGLGAIGIITKISLKLQKTFNMRQDLYQDLPLQSLADHFDDIMSSGYSVSLFTNWQDQKVSQIWIKRILDQEAKDLGIEFYGAKTATKNLHPIISLSAENCTEQMGVEGPWYDRLPHFKMGFTPSSGEELQSEYFVPREHAVEAILALEKKKDLIFPQLLISEIRSIAADSLWMSPCYQQDSVAIHFTWKPNWKEVSKLLPLIEAELSPYNVKPHWGKLFTMDPAVLQSRYKRFNDFLALIKKYDPQGKLRNEFLNLNIFSAT